MRLRALALCSVIVAGCSHASGPALLPADQQNGVRFLGVGYKSLYIFGGKPGGANPVAPVVDLNGTFYGTTLNGGANGDGIVFRMAPSGNVKILYNFAGSPDGMGPSAALVAVGTTLYGTTALGGANSDGIVFAIGTTGRETVLYSFKGGADGANPAAPLVDYNGALYGTTQNDGYEHYCCGTVFSITTTGAEHVLYRFDGKNHDGVRPLANLALLNGEFYGTTEYGGAKGRGTVFVVSPAGKERILYSFKGFPSDGAQPVGGLTESQGKLYGTTSFGGAGTKCGALGCGTVFEVSTSGAEKVLYSFKGRTDGSAPPAAPIAVGDALYGTTYTGGDLGCRGRIGCGTIYKVTASGASSLYTFEGGPDRGAAPEAGLVDEKGLLYGTTLAGGPTGSGSVFTIAP
jgi:uncharacterized repeat protein (TIGR03803 family)